MHGLLNDANKIIGFVNKVNRERMHSNHDRKTLEIYCGKAWMHFWNNRSSGDINHSIAVINFITWCILNYHFIVK